MNGTTIAAIITSESTCTTTTTTTTTDINNNNQEDNVIDYLTGDQGLSNRPSFKDQGNRAIFKNSLHL